MRGQKVGNKIESLETELIALKKEIKKLRKESLNTDILISLNKFFDNYEQQNAKSNAILSLIRGLTKDVNLIQPAKMKGTSAWAAKEIASLSHRFDFIEKGLPLYHEEVKSLKNYIYLLKFTNDPSISLNQEPKPSWWARFKTWINGKLRRDFGQPEESLDKWEQMETSCREGSPGD